MRTARAGTPLYRQLKEHVLAQMRRRRWSPGSRVPSENELVAEFGVSRMTANRALRELMQDGYLDRVRGLGTFVKAPPRQSSLIELRNIADEISARGHRHQSQVVELQKIRADRALSTLFESTRGKMLYKLTLLHLDNGIPVQLERRFVNPSVAPLFLRQDFTTTTPTGYLLEVAPVDELEHRVRAVLPDSETRRLLRIAAREPCLELNRLSWSNGLVVTSAILTYPASRYELISRSRTSPTGRMVAPVSALDPVE